MWELGRAEEAEAACRKALDLKPDLPEAHLNLGNALKDQGRPEAAIASYRRVLQLRPDDAQALHSLGLALRETGQPEAALPLLRRARDSRADFPEADINLGNALRDLGRLDEAIGCFRSAIASRPDYPEAFNNLGEALTEQGRPDEAVAVLRRALALRPDFPEAHSNLGNALRQLGALDEAVTHCRRAIALRPAFAEAHNNLGLAWHEQARLDEAIGSVRQAIALRPDYPDAHKNLALLLLTVGDLPAGWAEYEWRWQTAHQRAARRDFPRPQWRGEAAEGRTLLIHAEQGFGDMVQFCRYVPMAAARGLRVILEVQAPLLRLLRGLPGADQVLAFGEALPEFDLHCPILSLPLAFGTTLASIPSAGPYLRADAAGVAAWRTRLAATGQDLRVGLAWAGNPLAGADRRRSIAPDRLAPLFDVSGVRFFTLQKGGPAAPARFPLTDHMEAMADFADTAALIAALDLVISVDTAVAHLAAALGKPVWLLDRFAPCWRWLLGRRDSPWYPTLRLYRQTRPDDWESVLAEVARDLRCRAGP